MSDYSVLVTETSKNMFLNVDREREFFITWYTEVQEQRIILDKISATVIYL